MTEGKRHACSMSKDSLIQREENLTYNCITIVYSTGERWTTNTDLWILMYFFIFSLILALNSVAQSYISFSDHKASRQTYPIGFLQSCKYSGWNTSFTSTPQLYFFQTSGFGFHPLFKGSKQVHELRPKIEE